MGLSKSLERSHQAIQVMDVFRMNQVLRASPGCLPDVGFMDAKRNLLFDLILNPEQFQEVLNFSALPAIGRERR